MSLSLRTLSRSLRTVRHLLPEQAYAQLVHVIDGKIEPVRLVDVPREQRVLEAACPFLPAPAHARGDGHRLQLINRSIDFGERVDWDFAGEGALWSFHLHQFDWLRQPDLDAARRGELLLDWIERHPRGIGWRPHPISLRILSWGKLLLTPGALALDGAASERLRHSLACQAETLARNPERRLQANHLLSNWIGVVFAGALFAGERADAWLACASSLRRELERQIGPDGSHVERSPMYHALLLENLLDLLNLLRAAAPAGSGSSESSELADVELADDLADELARCTSRMLGALELWTHPDGEIALFADSAFGIAHPPARLLDYARSLGVEASAPRRPGLLEDTGFARLEAGPYVLISSLAGPMPAYQPGHSHCDALAFELSVAGQRVVTDTGVGGYVAGADRELCRATRSHATLEIAGREQAEIWGPHRIGGRPQVALGAADPPRSVEASCLGWRAAGARHHRRFDVTADRLVIRDRLDGGAHPVRIVFPLAPGLEVSLVSGADYAGADADELGAVTRAEIPLASGAVLVLELTLETADSDMPIRWAVERDSYFPQFGQRVERSLLVGRCNAFEAGNWAFELRPRAGNTK